MSVQYQGSLGSLVGRKLIKVGVAVISLLIILAVVNHLPPLINASPIVVSNNGLPSNEVHLYLSWFKKYGYYGYLSPQYTKFINQYFTKLQMPTVIYPISIANAIVDSLIFAVLIISAADFNILIRTRSKRLPEGGLIIFFLLLTIVVGMAYYSYMGVIIPLLGSLGYLYNWIFLLLILLPLIGLVVVGSRNLDAITDVLFSSMKRTVTEGLAVPPSASEESMVRCPKCGNLVSAGNKFCDKCGAPIATEIICAECGTKNEANAKFCVKCGKPLRGN